MPENVAQRIRREAAEEKAANEAEARKRARRERRANAAYKKGTLQILKRRLCAVPEQEVGWFLEQLQAKAREEMQVHIRRGGSADARIEFAIQFVSPHKSNLSPDAVPMGFLAAIRAFPKLMPLGFNARFFYEKSTINPGCECSSSICRHMGWERKFCKGDELLRSVLWTAAPCPSIGLLVSF
jgi:hypothetical protein